VFVRYFCNQKLEKAPKHDAAPAPTQVLNIGEIRPFLIHDFFNITQIFPNFVKIMLENTKKHYTEKRRTFFC
jgi:hypothetical protein